MSMSVERRGDLDVEWADAWSDYTLVNARFTAYTGGATTGYQSSDQGWPNVQKDVIPGDKLGRDEYAELCHIQREATLYVEANDAQLQDLTGYGRSDWNVLINDEPETTVDVQEIDGTDAGSQLELRNYGGLVDSGVLATSPPTETGDADLSGGGMMAQNSTREINYRETLGSGPVMDRFDNIKFLAGLSKSSTKFSATLEMEFNMWFDVIEMERENPFGARHESRTL